MDKNEYLVSEICRITKTEEIKAELISCVKECDEMYGKYDGSQSPKDWITNWMTDLEGGIEAILAAHGITEDNNILSELFYIISDYCFGDCF